MISPLLVFGVQTAAFGAVFLAQLWKYLRYSRFAAAPGRIIESKVQGLAYLIAYEFHVDGRQEFGSRLHSLNSDTVFVDEVRERPRLERLHAQFPEGSSVQVRYNRSDPGETYLINGPLSEILGYLAIALGFALVSAYFLLFWTPVPLDF